MFQASSRNFILQLFPYSRATYPATSIMYFAKCRGLI